MGEETIKDNRARDMKFYDAAAGLYDLTEFFRKGTRDVMVRSSECQSGDLVLDICTGTCKLALAFAKHGIRAVAVDLSREMLKVGRRKSSYDYLDFLQTDVLSLPFEDKSFDAVVVSLALHHMPEVVQIKVMKEMKRLSRNKVVMVEYHAPSQRYLQTIKGLIVQLMDESKLLQEWKHQDFAATCCKAGLEVEREEVLPVFVRNDDLIPQT